MTYKTAFIAAIGLTIAISTTAVADDDTQHPAHDSLVAFNDTFNDHAANHDIEGLVALYHEDAYWIAPNAFPAQGRDGVPRQTITFMSENQGELSHTIDELFISDDGTQAVMMGVTSARVESAGVNFQGTYIYVLERGSDDAPWQVVVDMYNNHPTE